MGEDRFWKGVHMGAVGAKIAVERDSSTDPLTTLRRFERGMQRYAYPDKELRQMVAGDIGWPGQPQHTGEER